MITDEQDTEAMMCNEVVGFLIDSTKAWQEVWHLALTGHSEQMLQNLILTAQLCALYFQVSWSHPISLNRHLNCFGGMLSKHPLMRFITFWMCSIKMEALVHSIEKILLKILTGVSPMKFS